MDSNSAIDRLAAGLATHGVDLSLWQPAFVLRRLQRGALLSGDVFVDRHVDRLLSEPDAREAFLRDLSIGVSEFFRDSLPFGHLEEVILRELVRRAPYPRALSLGCAQGQEVWSLAMLMAERFERFHVLGVDRHPAFIEAAIHGRYSTSELQRVSIGRIQQFFEEDGPGAWRIRPSLRSHARFALHDLSGGDLPPHVEPGSIALVLCRNVFIYLMPHARSRLLDAAAEALMPGGVLMLGAVDQMPPHSSFSPYPGRPGLFRREDA